jgi:four helix bundle protein
MGKVDNFFDLEIYKLADDLSKDIYALTAKFPKEEVYGITSQIRRAALSVGANIAESFGRFHYKDKSNFLYHTRGSLFEVLHFLKVAKDLGYISEINFLDLSRRINKLGIKVNNTIAVTKSQVINS